MPAFFSSSFRDERGVFFTFSALSKRRYSYVVFEARPTRCSLVPEPQTRYLKNFGHTSNRYMTERYTSTR